MDAKDGGKANKSHGDKSSDGKTGGGKGGDGNPEPSGGEPVASGDCPAGLDAEQCQAYLDGAEDSRTLGKNECYSSLFEEAVRGARAGARGKLGRLEGTR